MNNCENARDPKFRLMEVTKRGTENTSYVQAPCSRLGFCDSSGLGRRLDLQLAPGEDSGEFPKLSFHNPH